jgi:hypothetical protein
LEHFKKLQVNLEFHQNKCQPGVYLTRGGRVQRLLTSRTKGWPTGQTPWLVGSTLSPLTGWLCGDTLLEAVEGNSKLKVSGGRTPWPGGHVARLVSHHLACYRLNQFGNPPWTPINAPPYRWKSKQHTLHVVLHL